MMNEWRQCRSLGPGGSRSREFTTGRQPDRTSHAISRAIDQFLRRGIPPRLSHLRGFPAFFFELCTASDAAGRGFPSFRKARVLLRRATCDVTSTGSFKERS